MEKCLLADLAGMNTVNSTVLAVPDREMRPLRPAC